MMKFPKFHGSKAPPTRKDDGIWKKNMFKFILTVNRQPEIGWFLNGESS